MADSIRSEAQKQAEVAFGNFMLWTKRTTYAAIGFLLIVASCSFGVDGSGSKYNGEQYAPTNLKVK